jgi:hypothetical protein
MWLANISLMIPGRSAIVDLKCTLAKPFSPHGLHAEFTTTAYRNGVPDE